jgi:YD repeat-containing protein
MGAMRRSFLLGFGLLVALVAARAHAAGSITVRWWTAQQVGGGGGCEEDEHHPSVHTAAFSCETLASGGGTVTYEEWVAQTGMEIPPGCWPLGVAPGPAVANTCDEDKDQPPSCKTGHRTSDARKNGAGLVGDPVDLTTGSLAFDPVDVDLGRGFRFARHYASNTTRITSMGKSWSHSLDWQLLRSTAGPHPVALVKEPLRAPIPFVLDGGTYETNLMTAAAFSVEPSGVAHYTSANGVEVDFDASNLVSAIRILGEQPISVSYGTHSATYTNGDQTLVLTFYPTGHANAGRVSGLVANGELWTYSYDSSQRLTGVLGPDPSTVSASDTIAWAYVYNARGLIRLDRTTSAGTATLASWVLDNLKRVTSADEPTLEQPLLLSYVNLGLGRLQTTVKNASNQVLALFDSTEGAVTSVTNATGPAAPVAGGAGVPVPFAAASTVGAANFLAETETDQNGNVTLYEDYDDHGRPGRVVEGWIDGPTDPAVFSPDDAYARLTETTYHPVLQDPLTVTSPSVLPGGGNRVTTFDYDDPADPGDDPDVPNEEPTLRLHARIEQGYTLEASGAVFLATTKTSFAYDAAGRITSESGPRPENHMEHVYDASGNRTATRRYVDGPSSGYLENTFADFDARGNPQTVTDPNGRITAFTYDTAGRVKTVTPPYAGGGSTITSSYDVDGNLVRVDFPNDSFGQPYFVRLGYARRTASPSSPTRRATRSSTSGRPGASRARSSTAASWTSRTAARCAATRASATTSPAGC